jgi:2,4-dienoyl-CoA reductase-like NADH-dependent reductase (Old Yellow Enzyme family)
MEPGPVTSALFSPIRLRGLELPNRIVVSPMCQYAAESGSATDWHLMHLGQFAMGAASLVITEATGVSPEGRITHGCLGLWSDDNERALDRVLTFCRRYGVVSLGIQLAHAGRKASTRVPLKGGEPLADDEAPWQTVGPSAVPYAPGWHVPEALDAVGIAKVEHDFVQAAHRAQRLGFDLVEMHMAHGYLMHQFLSPLSNRRTDQYGGSLDNRMRLPLRVFAAVREVWPADKPLGVRVSATDWVEGGWTLEETIELARHLEAAGCDYIVASSGGLHPDQQIKLGPAYQTPFALAIKQAVSMPVMAVGLISDPAQAEAIVADRKADLVALARGVMDDPRWAWHAARALGAETAYADQYIRCRPDRWRPVGPSA